MAGDADTLESGPAARQVVKPGEIPVGDDQRGTTGVAGPRSIQSRASKRSAAGDVATGHTDFVAIEAPAGRAPGSPGSERRLACGMRAPLEF